MGSIDELLRLHPANSIALAALRTIQENNCSRQIHMPGREDGINVCRARK